MILMTGCFVPVMGQAGKGMQFFKGSWAELVAEAGKQQKMIFVDVYTDWCGPCKQMDKFVFPEEEVGKRYNPGFISYKLNAEKGEGIKIAGNFNIRAYPTFLYLDSEGYLIMKKIGETDVAGLTRLADSALRIAEKSTPANMEKSFRNGNREPAFLRRYITRLTQLDQDNTPALDEYFKALPYADLKKEETLLFLGNNVFSTQSCSFVFLMEHYPSLSQAAKDQLQDRLYAQIVGRSIPNALTQKRFTEFHPLLAYTAMLNPLTEPQQVYLERLKLVYYDLVRDQEQVKKTAYRWVARLDRISDDSIRAEDDRQYKKFIAPYMDGTKDSTTQPAFQEERELLRTVYSSQIAYKYYYPASLFAALPDTDIPALRDALQWISRAQQLAPGQKVYSALADSLRKRLK